MNEALFQESLHPIAEQLQSRCDGVRRIGGTSDGADRMVDQARAQGENVYTGLAVIPAGR